MPETIFKKTTCLNAEVLQQKSSGDILLLLVLNIGQNHSRNKRKDSLSYDHAFMTTLSYDHAFFISNSMFYLCIKLLGETGNVSLKLTGVFLNYFLKTQSL